MTMDMMRLVMVLAPCQGTAHQPTLRSKVAPCLRVIRHSLPKAILSKSVISTKRQSMWDLRFTIETAAIGSIRHRLRMEVKDLKLTWISIKAAVLVLMPLVRSNSSSPRHLVDYLLYSLRVKSILTLLDPKTPPCP